jgi:hypothetical protein
MVPGSSTWVLQHSGQLTMETCVSNGFMGSLPCPSEDEAVLHPGDEGMDPKLVFESWLYIHLLICLTLGKFLNLFFLTLLIHKNRDNNSIYFREL